MKDASGWGDDDDNFFQEGAIALIQATAVLTPDPWQRPYAVHLYLIAIKCKPIRDRCEPCQKLGFVVVSHCTTSHIPHILTIHLLVQPSTQPPFREMALNGTRSGYCRQHRSASGFHGASDAIVRSLPAGLQNQLSAGPIPNHAAVRSTRGRASSALPSLLQSHKR